MRKAARFIAAFFRGTLKAVAILFLIFAAQAVVTNTLSGLGVPDMLAAFAGLMSAMLAVYFIAS